MTGDKFLKLLRRRAKLLDMKADRASFEDSEGIYTLSAGERSFPVDFSKAVKAYADEGDEHPLEELLLQSKRNFSTWEVLDRWEETSARLRLCLLPENRVRPEYITKKLAGNLFAAAALKGESLIPFTRRELSEFPVPEAAVIGVGEQNLRVLLKEAAFEPLGDFVWEVQSADPRLNASLLACPEFYGLCREIAGKRFLAAVPAPQTLLIFSDMTNDRLERFGPKIVSLYEESKEPLSAQVFLFTPEGITVTGEFSVSQRREEDES